MLHLKNGTIANQKDSYREWSTWQIGETLRLSKNPTGVMTFQADGDELAIILEALKKFSTVSKAINTLVEIPEDPADL